MYRVMLHRDVVNIRRPLFRGATRLRRIWKSHCYAISCHRFFQSVYAVIGSLQFSAISGIQSSSLCCLQIGNWCLVTVNCTPQTSIRPSLTYVLSILGSLWPTFKNQYFSSIAPWAHNAGPGALKLPKSASKIKKKHAENHSVYREHDKCEI